MNYILRKLGFAPLLSTVALAVVLSATDGMSQVLYSETFTNNTGSSKGLSYVGWNSYISSTAVDVSNTATYLPSGGGNEYFSTAAGVGNPTGTNGYMSMYSQPATGTETFTAYKTGLNLSLTSGVSTITWQMNATAAGKATTRILVQVGGSWYASNATFTPTDYGTDFAAATTGSYTFSTLASNWVSFSITPGTSMALGSALGSDLSSSTITGIGFYSDVAKYATFRVDTLAVNAVPEPNTVALLLLGAIGMLGMGSRCRKVV